MLRWRDAAYDHDFLLRNGTRCPSLRPGIGLGTCLLRLVATVLVNVHSIPPRRRLVIVWLDLDKALLADMLPDDSIADFAIARVLAEKPFLDDLTATTRVPPCGDPDHTHGCTLM